MTTQGQRRAAKARRRQIRKIKVMTGGQAVPGLPFMGETMTCGMCGKVQQSDPKVESGWRALDVDGKRYHVCPDHFPPDATGTREQMRLAYVAILRKIYAEKQS